MDYFREILYLLGNDRAKLPGMVLLFLIVSLLDVIGIGLIGPYVSLIMDPALLNGGIIEITGVSLSGDALVFAISAILVSVFFIKGIAGVFILKMIVSFSYKQQVSLRSRLMHSYQSMSYVDYVTRNSAEYIYAIQVLVSTYTGKIIMLGLKATSNILVTIAIILLLAWTDVKLLGMLLLLVSIVSIIYDRLIRKSIQLYGKDANIASTNLMKGLSEGVEGMKEIRILGKAEYFHDVVHSEAVKYANNLKTTEVLTSIPRYLIEFVLIAFLASMVTVELLNNGDINQLLPALSMFAVASLKLIPSINLIATGIVQFRFNRNTVSLLYKDIKKYEYTKNLRKESSNNEFSTLTLKSVKYRYPQADELVINGIDFSIKKGESIGLIGPSGSGKTTLVDVILGLLKPQEGDIILNGKKVNDCIGEWQNMVAYLPQEVFIIDDTLKNNIALGINPTEINDQDLNEAIEHSRLGMVIDKLPRGVDTRLGERGVSFSGGQRQKVALARAIYHKRKILVMDEATSSLDESTEKEVVDEIRRLKGDVTMIIIAHRYNTLKFCDRIYRLNGGRIVEELTYEELNNK